MSTSYAVKAVARQYPTLPLESIRNRLDYSTFVNYDRRYMYFEVPKAGCTAIKTLIQKIEGLPSAKAFVGSHREVRRDMFIHERSQLKIPSLVDFDDAKQEEILHSPDFFRFTVVRNPYTRLQSAWQDKIRLCAPQYLGMYRDVKGALPDGRNPSSIISFREFVTLISLCDLTTCDHHWRLQTAHLFLPVIQFTCIGRLERFDETIAAWGAHLGEGLEPPRPANESVAATEYDQGIALQIYALYQRDFDALGYGADTWPRPPESGKLRVVAEARFVEEVLERNLIIGLLYESQERLTDRASVKSPTFIDRYRNQSFEYLYDTYIQPTDGWLGGAEAQLLFELARDTTDACIVEVGSYRGRSTIALALGTLVGSAVPVYAIDPHETFVGPLGGKFGPIDRGHFMQRMIELGLFHIVHLVNLSSEYLTASWPLPVGLLWIDGDHRYPAVMRDFSAWKEKLGPKANIVFDDAVAPESGPARVIKDLLASGSFSMVEQRGKVVWVRRVH